MSKFQLQLQCSCIVCKQLTTVQSLTSHIRKRHTVPATTCTHCNIPTKNKFCSKSCSAAYNNIHHPRKTGPMKGTGAFSALTNCPICNVLHRYGNTCSTKCKSVLLSMRMRERIAQGFDPRANRGRGKQSYLEKSFSHWIAIQYPNLPVIQEKSFKRLDMPKTYFVDFFFPTLNLVIELDGSQHNNTQEYDRDRDAYLSNQYKLSVLRVTHKEYQNKSRLREIQSILSGSNR